MTTRGKLATWLRNSWHYVKDRTGFFAYTDVEGKKQSGKTLWDWMQLLVIPVMIALGTVWFSNFSRQSDMLTMEKRLQEEKLNSYLAKMEMYILERGLLSAIDQEESPILRMAKVQTVTALRSMNTIWQNLVMQFLHDAGIVTILNYASMQSIDLSWADLYGASLRGANLYHAYLYHADLSEADLSFTNLRLAEMHKANLSGAYLFGAYLRGANLSEASLRKANLRKANLREASLRKANLRKANLSEAYLSEANLSKANLGEANLGEANLSYANLSDANLREADLFGADLRGADLGSADLRGANLSEACLVDAIFSKEQLGAAMSLDGAILPDDDISKCNPSEGPAWPRPRFWDSWDNRGFWYFFDKP